MSPAYPGESKKDNPTVSVVVPAYNEAENLSILYSQLRAVLQEVGMPYEMIYVDDGSSDNTWAEILKLHESEKAVKGLRLSRNFGHQYALFAGLQSASGAAVICMDADLQHPPPVVKQLIEEWQRGNQIVNTVRLDPKDLSLFKKISARVFYSIFSWLSGVKLEHGMADFRLLDRQVVDELLKFREEGLFLRGLVKWVGYRSSVVRFECGERFRGVTKYTFHKMLKFAWHGVSSFSLVPLRIGTSIGIVASAASFYFLLEALYVKLVSGTAVPGWASTIGIISLLFGILFIFLGLLAEYLGRVLVQVRARPLFLVADRVGLEKARGARDS